MTQAELAPDPQTAGGHEPFLVNRFGDHYLHSVNRNSFRQIGAEAVLKSHLDKDFWSEDTLTVVIGTDSGLLVEYVLRHTVPAGSRYLFVELPEVLDRVAPQLAEALAQEPRVVVCGPDAWQSSANELDFASYVFINKLRLVQSVAAASAYLPEYRHLTRAVRADMEAWRWALSTQLQSRNFIDCQLKNLPVEMTAAEVLKQTFSGETAVILAGGPSLDEILPWVKTHRDRFVLLAVSRVARNLRAADIVPDLICTIDPTTLSFEISREMLEFPEHVVLAASYHANPALLAQWRGRVVYHGPRLPWKSELNVTNIQTAGPTVTSSALLLAIQMGFGRIILGGLDLCFSRSGHTHASGSNEHKAGPRLGFMGQRVMTNAGYWADTIDSMLQSVTSIQDLAAVARSAGCQVINPAAGAARIGNVDHIPLDGIELPPPRDDLWQRLESLVPQPEPAALHRYYRSIIEELRRVEWKLRDIRKLAQEGLRCNDGLFGRNGMKADFKFKHKMDKLEKRLDNRYSDLGKLVKRYGVTRFLRILRPNSDKEWADHEVEETGRVYYEAYRDGAKELLASVRAARERLELRIAEDEKATDFGYLAEQWRTAGEPGRARLWRERHAQRAAALPASGQAALDALEAEFRRLLTTDDTNHMRRCKAEADLGEVPAKAAHAFRHNDVEQLHLLEEGLAAMTAEQVHELPQLVRGYQCELEGRTDEALEAFLLITREELLEDTMRRITSLTIARKDYSSTLLALECLARISPSYMPQFAEMLRIVGDIEKACTVYGEYLQSAPEDYTALLRLGKIYLEQNVLDGARWAFQHILEHEPDNRAARVLLAETEEKTNATTG